MIKTLGVFTSQANQDPVNKIRIPRKLPVAHSKWYFIQVGGQMHKKRERTIVFLKVK